MANFLNRLSQDAADKMRSHLPEHKWSYQQKKKFADAVKSTMPSEKTATEDMAESAE